MSALVPSESWATHYGEDGIDDACPSCGAFVESRALHRDWHLTLAERLDAIGREAGRYKSPPTYFGLSPDELSDTLNAVHLGGTDG